MIEQGIMSHAETNGNIKLCLLLVEKSGLCDGIAHGFKFMGMTAASLEMPEAQAN